MNAQQHLSEAELAINQSKATTRDKDGVRYATLAAAHALAGLLKMQLAREAGL